uniref:DNA replication and repair protein RecF n=1 Tax=Candidatus Kentrum sp. TUN TaxID=2126343 RepID=A0A451AE21_9GAMM|nr:MAG: DNA replication and repair protein RecF [Candidatus Kentron sp. TUN]VFK64305.1 MAG: DNA replication and repair protein RecF [Candidatus Kentron sp. TUN]
MNLVEITIQNIRVIRWLRLAPSKGLNVLIGPNGSGKTSVLEGVHLLGIGRSFRGRVCRAIITQGEENCAVSGLVDKGLGKELRMGIEKGKYGSRVRVGNREVTRASELAQNLPLLVLSPDDQSLLTKGSRERQRFLDWILFHVEPSYFNLLYRYFRALRQRNFALRQMNNRNLLLAWDEELGKLGELVDKFRRKSVETLFPILCQYLSSIMEVEVAMKYTSGWNVEQPLTDILRQRVKADEKLGYTFQGPHRGDLCFTVQGIPAYQRLSRGETKQLILALVLAQARCLYEQTGVIPVLLLDELTAELDKPSLYRVSQALMALQAQVFVTMVSEQMLNDMVWCKGKMFHVEHGTVRKLS